MIQFVNVNRLNILHQIDHISSSTEMVLYLPKIKQPRDPGVN